MLSAEILCGIINQEVHKIFIKPEKKQKLTLNFWKRFLEKLLMEKQPAIAISQEETVCFANQPKHSLNLVRFKT